MKMLFASLLAIAFSPAATLLHAQSQETAALYAAARPYTDETLSQLKAHVHELSGIKPDINQTELPGLLASVSEVIMAQMPRVPNLIAHEEIALEEPATPTPAGGYSGGSGIGGSGRSRAACGEPRGVCRRPGQDRPAHPAQRPDLAVRHRDQARLRSGARGARQQARRPACPRHRLRRQDQSGRGGAGRLQADR